jgi:hypothetical protein
MTLGNAETVTGAKSFNSSTVLLKGSSSGTTTLNAAATASGTITVPAATDTLVGKATTDTLTNKSIDTAGSNTIKVNGNTLSASAGTATVTVPNSTDTLVGRATTDTLTNKTLTAPVISTIVNTGTLTLPTATDTITGRATTDTLTNKTIDTASNTFKLGGVAFGTATQATAALNGCVGDSGSGGTKGLVPAPGAGDAAAGKFLKADCTWAAPAGGGGGGSLSDTDRQNILLDRVTQAKLYGSYRRVLSAIADGYADSSGIAAGSSSNYSVNTGSKFVTATTSDQRITGGTPSVPLGGTAANINDNTSATTSTTGAVGNVSAAPVGSRIMAEIDYGTNKTVSKIEVINVALSSSSNPGFGVYYSTDGTNWTQLGSNHSVSTVASSFTESGSVTARYIALVTGTGNFGSVTSTVADLNGYTPISNNVTLVTTAQTADSTASNVRVLMSIDDSASPTLNTDITAEVSCDGGSHYSSASLSSYGRGQSGRLVVESVDQACGTSGTSVQARIKTLNSLIIPIYGTSVTWH